MLIANPNTAPAPVEIKFFKDDGATVLHNVTLAATWGLAEGRVGGANNAQTYIPIANPGSLQAEVTATFLRADGTPLVKTFGVLPESRCTIAINGASSHVPELANESFGTAVTSTQPAIIDRALYTDAGGVMWAAGTNATATRLPSRLFRGRRGWRRIISRRER